MAFSLGFGFETKRVERSDAEHLQREEGEEDAGEGESVDGQNFEHGVLLCGSVISTSSSTITVLIGIRRCDPPVCEAVHSARTFF
jgi:hypothetical protein